MAFELFGSGNWLMRSHLHHKHSTRMLEIHFKSSLTHNYSRPLIITNVEKANSRQTVQ